MDRGTVPDPDDLEEGLSVRRTSLELNRGNRKEHDLYGRPGRILFNTCTLAKFSRGIL